MADDCAGKHSLIAAQTLFFAQLADIREQRRDGGEEDREIKARGGRRRGPLTARPRKSIKFKQAVTFLPLTVLRYAYT
jgi:hypothetical protein